MKKTLSVVISILMIITTLVGTSVEAFAKTDVKSITLSKSTYTYNDGIKHTPKVTIKNTKGQILKQNRDYDLYRPNEWDTRVPGKYTILIYFKGNYHGSSNITYSVLPRKTQISSLTSKSKEFTVYWKKKADITDISGYQIQYSTNKNFKSAKNFTIKDPNCIGAVINDLKPKKKYYIRMRTMCSYSNFTYGKNHYTHRNKGTIYSSWSKIKSVTTKK